MTVKYNVLKKLSSGENVSGESLAKELGVSRNSVWKAINSLRKDGYDIVGQTNLGYKLVSKNDVLSREIVEEYLKTKNLDIHTYESIGSTNTELKLWAQRDFKEGTVIIAEQQKQGRGRLGRSFSSPSKTGLYVSILLRPKFSVSDALFITTATAVAVSRLIENHLDEDVKIKWVNDIYMNNKKVCGILTEAAANFETGLLDYAIVGIGLNLLMPENGFDEEIKDIAGHIFDKLPEGGRAKIAAELVDNFFEIYSEFPRKDFMDEYRSKSYLDGKEVTMSVGNKMLKGIVLEVNENAEIVVKLENGEIREFSAGEALLKKK